MGNFHFVLFALFLSAVTPGSSEPDPDGVHQQNSFADAVSVVSEGGGGARVSAGNYDLPPPPLVEPVIPVAPAVPPIAPLPFGGFASFLPAIPPGLFVDPTAGLVGPSYIPQTWLGSAFGAKGDILFPLVIFIFFIVGVWAVIQFLLTLIVPVIATKLGLEAATLGALHRKTRSLADAGEEDHEAADLKLAEQVDEAIHTEY